RAARLGDELEAFAILREQVDDLTTGDSPNGGLIVARELAGILVAGERLTDAAALLGHIDASGVEGGGGFDALLVDSRSRIEADPEAAEVRARTALRVSAAPMVDGPTDLLQLLADTLDGLLDRS
ncbi:MAG: hypothetical protein AAFO29_23120, partial [Actinomycetota bacterium]